MKCWKNDLSHDGKKTCKHKGCDGLAPVSFKAITRHSQVIDRLMLLISWVSV